VIGHDDIPRDFNAASRFLDRNLLEGNGDRVALRCGDEAVTYAELAGLTNRVGNVLRELGARREERVLLALSDGPEFVASWYAALKIGAVTAEAYTFLQAHEYAYYLRYARPRVVIVDEIALPRVREACRDLAGRPALLVLGDEPLEPGEHRFAALVAEASDLLEPAPTSRDDLAIWKFTTGSTGDSKAAVHTMCSPLVAFENYARDVVGYREDDVVLPVPKLFFGYARDTTALFTFGVGACGVVFPERSTPELLFELIERHRPTIMVQVPTMMRAMLEHENVRERDLSSLRLCISSGETLPEEIHRRWLETFGVEVLEGLGSSELYHIFVSNRPGRARLGSIGQVVPGYRVRLTDSDGGDVPDGTPGELWASGDSSALFYWNDRAKSRRTFQGAWVRTGDLFTRDGDGYFRYVGRADDLLKVGGIWVAPAEIEGCLLRHDAVQECGVVGVLVDGLTVPCAYVVPSEPASDDLAAALREFVRAEISPHKAPRLVRFVAELPKTASGKIDRRALREVA
jgi:benzoate-CoA ligase family protein